MRAEQRLFGEIELAMYILNENYQSMNLKLDSIVPRENPYLYNFSISNYNETERTDIEIRYELKVSATTNLPLTYELYLNETKETPDATNIIRTNNVAQDDDETYFRTMTTDAKEFGYTQDEINLYQLVIYFPENYDTVDYQDIIESIEIIVNSTQIIR